MHTYAGRPMTAPTMASVWILQLYYALPVVLIYFNTLPLSPTALTPQAWATVMLLSSTDLILTAPTASRLYPFFGGVAGRNARQLYL